MMREDAAAAAAALYSEEISVQCTKQFQLCCAENFPESFVG